MFSQSFVGGEAPRKPYTLLVSTTVQMIVVAALAIAPLIYMQGLPNAQLRSLLFAPPRPPVAIPALRTPVGAVSRVVPKIFSINRLRPIVPPAPHQTTGIPEPAAPGITVPGNEVDEGVVNSWGGDLLGQVPVPPPLATGPKARETNAQVRVGGSVAEANLIHRVQPAYPALARSARVAGVVRFRAVISKIGAIDNLQLISGHPLLVQAAREAILQWRYHPTMLNGEPVEVITEISVLFSLSN